MNFEIKKSFKKDISKIKDKILLKSIHDTILEIEKAQKIRDIKNIEKMQGYKTFYRIKLGNYRIGLKIDNKHIIIVRVLHRKEIYRYFP